MARRARRSRGFWRGLLTGVGLAGLVAAGLAYLFPPAIFLPPEIEAARQVAPGAPAEPAAPPVPDRPQDPADVPARASLPPAAGAPGAEPVPDMTSLMPSPAPVAIEGARDVPLLTAPPGGLIAVMPPSPGAISGTAPAMPPLGARPAGDGGPGIDTASPAQPRTFAGENAVQPPAPEAPERAAGPGQAGADAARPPAPAASGAPSGELSPGIGGFAPPPAPAIFDGGGAGAPSLAAPR